ncbi:MAG: UbiD family decarboxylase, partial [Alphaproteobacteria bacterium]|nr:UbiD family decarboxylase [Alphaproteobacteria bacterium]
MRPNERTLDLRSFLEDLEAADPESVLRIPEPVALDFDATAVAMELERQGRAPVIRFDKVGDSPFPVVANLFGDRRRYAQALGVSEADLIETWGGLGDRTLEPVILETGPVLDRVVTGSDVDLAALPIMNHFAEDGGRYVTNGIVVARDPDSGVRNASYHRLQVMGRTRFGTSL